jgi:LPS O-antigen subunit length determinant protein (WzzB/FepE family)
MANKVTLRNTVTGSAFDKGDNFSEEHIRQYEIDVAALMKLLLQKRRWIIWSVGLASVLAALIMILTPNRYTSTAVILSSGNSDRFSAFKAMAGLSSVLGGGDANSSDLFPVILRSHLVRDSLLSKTYEFSFKDEPMRLTLAEYLRIDDPDRRREALGRITTVSSDTRTGEISLAVETKYPEFSQALVSEYLNQLEIFNLYSRRSEARERVRYLTREVDERRRTLAEAEDSLSAYQSRNRTWAVTSDPIILKEVGRLRRDVEIKVQTLAYLTQEFEAAKLDAQKDVPVVRVLDLASLPTLKSGPHRTIAVLAAGAVSFFLVVCGIIGLDLVRQVARNSQSPAKEELAALTEASFPRSRQWYIRVKSRLHRQPISLDK